MENGQKKLKELFDGRKIFNIPDYQRAYAWEDTRQLPDFIEDIDNQSLERDYFFGTILFQEKSEKQAGFDIIDIVDGQQRITTIIIFMKVLLDVLEARMGVDTFEEHGLDLIRETYVRIRNRSKLQAISPDNDFFQSYILGDDSGRNHIETPSQRRLLKAKDYFYQVLHNRSTETLLNLKSKLDEHTKVLTYSVKDAAEATLIFETTNDRGKSLTNLEKIKSFLMYKTYLSADENTEHYLTTIQQRFSDIFRESELFEGKLNEDTVLQYHCIAFEKWSDKEHYQQPVSYVRSILNRMISQGKKQEALDFIDRFSRELKESFRMMREILNGKSKSYRDLVCLERLGNFYPLLLKSYKFDVTVDKVKFETACKFLEILSFRVFAIQQNRSNTGQARLYTMTRDFSGKYDSLYIKLIDMIENLSPKKYFRENLHHSQLYEWMTSRDLCYMMWKYENHLRTTEQPVCSNMSEDEYKATTGKTKLTVEHIASQTPNSIVKAADILPKLDDQFIENNLHRLGNLTFDPASANASKGNQDIEVKNSKYFTKAPYKTQNELESFLTDVKWTVESIDAREQKIVNFCMHHWNPQLVEY